MVNTPEKKKKKLYVEKIKNKLGPIGLMNFSKKGIKEHYQLMKQKVNKGVVKNGTLKIYSTQLIFKN